MTDELLLDAIELNISSLRAVVNLEDVNIVVVERNLSEMCTYTAHIAQRAESSTNFSELNRGLQLLREVEQAVLNIEQHALDALREFIPNLTLIQARDSMQLSEFASKIDREIFLVNKLKLNGLQLLFEEIKDLRLPARLPMRIETIENRLTALRT